MTKVRCFAGLLMPLLAIICTSCVDSGLNFNAEATSLVNEAVQNRVDLQSITARGEMKIIDKSSKFSLGVKIEMVALNPDRMRLRATKLAEAIVAFDMLMQGDNLAFYVPTRNTLFTGNVSNLKSGGVNFSPEKIISRILKADRGLLDRRWRILGTSKDGLFSQNLVLEQIHSKGEGYVRIHIDGQRKVLLKVMHYDRSGKLFFLEEYDGYREQDSGERTLSGRKIGSGVYFPTRYFLSWPDKERSVRVTLRGYEMDTPVQQLSEYWTIDDLDLDSVKRRKLSDIQVESDQGR